MKEESDTELADKDLIPILEKEDNKICNDCGKKTPLWSSINNAVLICSSCARTHKKFNPNISKVKSLEVDPWTKEEINFLKIGGNAKFTNLIKSYNIPLTKENQEYKYYTKAAQYYRDILVEESKNNNINNIVKPSLKEGIELLYKDEYSNLFNKYISQQNNVNTNNNNNSNQINENNNYNNNNISNNNIPLNNNNNDSWINKMVEKLAPDINNVPYNNNSNNNGNNSMNILDNIKNNMIDAYNDVKEMTKDIDITEKFRMAGQYVYNKTEKIQNSDAFKGFVNSVSTGIESIIEKTDKLFKPGQNNINNLNQINQNQNNSLKNNNINNINNSINNINTNINNNEQLNLFNQQNINNQNLNSNKTGFLENIVNKIEEPKFQSNYSSINNDNNSQYDNYINQLNNKTNENSNNNMNNLNQENNKDKIEEDKAKNNNNENNKEEKKDDNIESLDNAENENDPNLLIMSNMPKNN